MKYLRNCTINNAIFEISYNNSTKEFNIHNNNQINGIVSLNDEGFILANGNKEQKYYNKEQIENVKSILIKIMRRFEKKYTVQHKIVIVLNNYSVRKRINQSDTMLQKSVENYYAFSYIIYNRSDNIIASRYYVAEQLNEKLFADRLIDDYAYFLTPQNTFVYSDENLILSSEAASKFFHEFIGHLLEEDHFAISPLRYKFGTRVFPKNLNIFENVNVQYKYDDMGNIIKRNVCLVKDGVICNLLTDKNKPHGYECTNTGNAIINSYIDRFIPRMRSMQVVLSTKAKDKELSGIYIKDLDTCEMNAEEGVIAFTASKSYILKQGKVMDCLSRFTFLLSVFDLNKAEISSVGQSTKYVHYCIKNNQKVFTKCKCSSVIVRFNND